ncbi:hypothetical protein IWZ01DRAFT_553222 [Phyllosticta capitalensis]
MLFQTEEQALSFLTSHSTSYHLTLFAPAATRIYAIDGLLFSFLLERGLPFAVAADVPLLSPRVKLDQLTRLVDAAHAYQRKNRSLARFVAAVGGLDGDLLSVLKRVVRGEEEEFGGEVEAVAKVCFAAMERERDNSTTNKANANAAAAWTLPELSAALNDELSTFWANERKRADALNNPPGFSRQAKFELQAIFDEEDRAVAEAKEAKRRAEEQRQQEWVREQMRICEEEARERERQRQELEQEQERWRRFCEMERRGELGPDSEFGRWLQRKQLLEQQQQGQMGQGRMQQMQGQMGQQSQFGQLQQQQGQMVQGQMGGGQQGMGQMGMGQGHGQQRGGG